MASHFDLYSEKSNSAANSPSRRKKNRKTKRNRKRKRRMDFTLPFVSCALCHEKDNLFLTSCAHLLCHQHAARDAVNKHDLDHSKTRCPFCSHDQVSLVKINHRLPDEIRPFFTPFPNQVEQLFAAAQFQYCGMVEKIQYQNQMIDRLMEKVNKQKELLLIAKEKVSQISQLESTIKRLEDTNKRLMSNSMSHRETGFQAAMPPPTVDLTTDSIEEPPLSGRKSVTKSFIDQVKQSSSQKSISLSNYKYSHDENHTMDLENGRLAESTNILRHSPVRSNVPAGSKLKPLLRLPSASSSHRTRSMSSNGSGNNSFTSRSDHMPSINLKPTAPRISKNRAATSQLAQKLTAHMKVGALNNRSQSSTGIRPGSSFANPNPLFRKS